MSKKLDSQWYGRLATVAKEINDIEWLQSFMHMQKSEQKRFFENQIENPKFTYQPEGSKVVRENMFDELLWDIEKNEKNAVVEDLYRKKIEMQLARCEMIQASLHRDDKAFFKASAKIYGEPKKKYFAYVASRVKILCQKNAERYPTESKRLLKHFSKINTSDTDISVGILPPPTKEGQKVESLKQVLEIFQSVFDRLEIGDWQMKVDAGGHRTRFSVSQESRTIHFPSEAQLLSRPEALTETKIRAIAEHEVAVHVRRGYEGSQSPLLLLQHGLHKYLGGEEGLASYVQQQIEGASEFYGFDRYLAACLAVGMDGSPRDFRAVFSIMSDYYQLTMKEKETAKKKNFEAAWEVCVRIFRGTTGQAAGSIYTKDILYMEGNIGIWHLLSERPQVFESLFIGKFNPLMSHHIKSLQTLDILKEW